MTRDEWTYAILLVISVLFGFVFKNIPGPAAKRLVGCLVGFSMVVIVCGWHFLHSLVTIIINIILIRTCKKNCQIWGLLWCFTYLLFFRTTHYFGLPKVPAVSNAVQLLLTLKMIGLAFEIADSTKLRKDVEENPDSPDLVLRMKYESINPSNFDIIAYGYCYIGLLTGPYFKFRTYYDMLHLDASQIDIVSKFLERLKHGLMCTVIFLIASRFYWIDYAHSEEFLSRPFLYKFWFMIPMFTWFRARMYAAWIVSECVCITSCLGAYPSASKPKCGKGPTDLTALENKAIDNPKTDYDFETVHNIDVYGCEFNPTVRGSMKAWNMSVQYWLAAYIYKRCPWKSMRTAITMAVSAYWHGIHPGYYMSFMTIPICLMGEDLCASAFREKLSGSGKAIYDVLLWFFRCREVDYMCMGFLLLRFDYTINYWYSIYFCMHIFALFSIILGMVGKRLFHTKNKRIVDHIFFTLYLYLGSHE